MPLGSLRDDALARGQEELATLGRVRNVAVQQETVSKTQFLVGRSGADASQPVPAFADALAFARKLHGRVAVRDTRSHLSIRLFVAALGLAVREARRNPVAVDEACRKARIRATRLEVRVARLVAGTVGYRHGASLKYGENGGQDQIARWANAAAYVARPPNGDAPPTTFRDAVRYVCRRGGVRKLSNLYARRGTPEVESPSTRRKWVHYDFADENSTCEWFTPKYVFDCLECKFDLDPASPGRKEVDWIPAKHHFTENGLEKEWFGFVWMNPPFGRNELVRWTEKFIEHANGICLVPDRTFAMWWQNLASDCNAILCMRDRIRFENGFGDPSGAFPIGTHLIAFGERAVQALIVGHRNGLGVLLNPFRP